MLESLFFLIGFLFLLKLFMELLHQLQFLFPGPTRPLNGWACITGGSEGIGLGMASYLASQGTNLILISRSPSKLSQAKQQLQSFPVQVQTFSFDLGLTSPSDFSRISAALSPFHISLLVNCAGTSHTGFFHELSLQDTLSMIALNVWPVVVLSKMFPDARIINVSSTASVNPTPGLSVYSATKAFIHCFTCVLGSERKEVLSHQCGFVNTEMTRKIKYKPFVIESSQVAEDVVRNIGSGYTFGHWKHQVMGMILGVLPVQITSHSILKLLRAREKRKRA